MMDSQSVPVSSGWVPFPGSKRKADSPLPEELRASPAKICVRVSSSELESLKAAGRMLEMSGICDGGEDLTRAKEQMQPRDEEMATGPPEEQVLSPQGQNAGVDHNFDRGDLSPYEHEKHEQVNNNSPKLYFFEGLREVLLNKQNDDLIRSLATETQKSTSLAMVLWKPLHHIHPSSDPDTSPPNGDTEEQLTLKHGENENSQEDSSQQEDVEMEVLPT